MKYPNEIYIWVDDEGGENECWLVEKDVEGCATIGEKRHVGKYRLVESLTVETKTVTHVRKRRE